MNHFLIATSDTVIGQVRNFADAYDYQAAANARLMAAAPDLLDSAHAALAYVVSMGNLRDGTEASQLQLTLRTAIAKAEGRS
jgi:hypothetical protein